jgi:hypothetical protein
VDVGQLRERGQDATVACPAGDGTAEIPAHEVGLSRRDCDGRDPPTPGVPRTRVLSSVVPHPRGRTAASATPPESPPTPATPAAPRAPLSSVLLVISMAASLGQGVAAASGRPPADALGVPLRTIGPPATGV